MLDGYYAAGPVEYREIGGIMHCIQEYKNDHEHEYTIMQMNEGLPHGMAQLFVNGFLRLQWTMDKGKRVGEVTVYEDGVAVKKVNWDYFYSSEDERAIENQKTKEVMIITSAESDVVVYRGGFNSEMKREGFGIEYNRSTGEPLYSGVFKKDKLYQISQEFVDSTKMIEYKLEAESNVSARTRHPVYVGEFKWNPLTEVYQRHGKGREIDPMTGLAIREGKWKEGVCVEKEPVVIVNGWYLHEKVEEKVEEKPEEKPIAQEVLLPIEEEKEMVTISEAFELNSLSREVKTLIIHQNVDLLSGNSTLTFSNLQSLISIRIDDSCFLSVAQFTITNNNKLETISIGMNCFTTKPQEWGKVDGREFHLTHCASLNQISIGRYSFSDYTSCEFSDLPVLESMIIGNVSSPSFCFPNANFQLSGA